MSNHFKGFDIRKDPAPSPTKSESARIVKGEAQAQPVVQQYDFGSIKAGKQTYSAVKEKYGALAATDVERASRAQKDRRFSLNHLVRGPLSVDEEERRAIADKVKAEVDAQAGEARRKAAEAGYQEGLKRGYEEAFRNFKDEGRSRIEQLERLLAAAEAAKGEIFRANERFLVDLIYRMGKMVMLRELSTDKEYVRRLASELIERVGVRENIKVHISPEDKETLLMLKEELEQSFGGLKNLTVEASPQVNGGGCFIETEYNAIDASVETQLQGIREALLGQGSAR